MTAPHFYGVIWERARDHQCFVSIPRRTKDYERFEIGITVTLSLADEPTVQMQSHVRDKGDGTRYAKIMRRGQAELADRFADGTGVRVELCQ